MGEKKSGAMEKKSQAAQLKRLVRQALSSVAIGGVLLVGFIGFNMGLSSIRTTQINTTVALNQYRIASKKLTYDIQSYAVTGEQKYYDGYIKELNQDKNREQAIEALKDCALKEDEWASLNQIAAMSDQLVPLEQEAITYVQAGDLAAAGLDVLSAEPMRADHPLQSIKDSGKLLITPHIAWAGAETRRRLMDLIQDQIAAFCKQ